MRVNLETYTTMCSYSLLKSFTFLQWNYHKKKAACACSTQLTT